MMGHRLAYSAEAKINRRDYGLTFDMVLDGKLIVGNEVQINLEGEFIEVDEEKKPETASA